MMNFCIWHEKVKGKGEDAPPTLITNEQEGVLVVYDGLGGAGSNVHIQNGETQSGAKIAAYLAKSIVEEHYRQPSDAALDKKLKDGFRQYLEKYPPESSALKTKLTKNLPTTLSILKYKKEESHYDIQALWAGDSRSYLITTNGMIQISEDDVYNYQNALDSLHEDGRISNCIQGDGNFHIHEKNFSFAPPFVLLNTTDGCFDYVLSPAHFEYLILSALFHKNTSDVPSWKECIFQKLIRTSGDDFSMAVHCIGFQDIEQLKESMVNRFQLLKLKYIDPVNQLQGQINFLKKQEEEISQILKAYQSKKNKIIKKLWENYKIDYESLNLKQSKNE